VGGMLVMMRVVRRVEVRARVKVKSGYSVE
jgi:hypothetical protein